jgi:hypothetical protein
LKLVLDPNGLKWNHETTVRERAFRLFVRRRGEEVVAADVLMQRAEKFCGALRSKLVARSSVRERPKNDRSPALGLAGVHMKGVPLCRGARNYHLETGEPLVFDEVYVLHCLILSLSLPISPPTFGGSSYLIGRISTALDSENRARRDRFRAGEHGLQDASRQEVAEEVDPATISQTVERFDGKLGQRLSFAPFIEGRIRDSLTLGEAVAVVNELEAGLGVRPGDGEPVMTVSVRMADDRVKNGTSPDVLLRKGLDVHVRVAMGPEDLHARLNLTV